MDEEAFEDENFDDDDFEDEDFELDEDDEEPVIFMTEDGEFVSEADVDEYSQDFVRIPLSSDGDITGQTNPEDLVQELLQFRAIARRLYHRYMEKRDGQ